MAKKLTGATNNGASYTPEFATRDLGLGHPWIDATPPFILVYSPQRWMVLAGRLVPMLSKTPLLAGVNRIEIDKDKRIRFAATRAKLEEEGRLPIPYEWGPGGQSYLTVVETRPNGSQTIQTAHVSVWESCHAGDRLPASDEDGYSRWLASLVKSGKLPACPPHLARRLLERASEALEEAEAMSSKHGGRATIRAKAIRAKVDALTKASGRGTKAKAKAATPLIED